MSATYTVNTGNYSFKSPGPGTVEEYDQQAGKVGSCLEDAVYNSIYRGHIPAFWEAFIPKAEALTGIARAVDEKATERARAKSKNPEKVKDVMEKALNYDERVRASVTPDIISALDALAVEVGSALVIDVSEKQRTSGPGASFLAKADSVLTRDADGIESAVTKLSAVVPAHDLLRDETGKPDRVSLAELIKKYTDIQAAI